jgi:hypothetical protein
MMTTMRIDDFKISPRITVLPVIHGSGDAQEVRRRCRTSSTAAVPLPVASGDVERAIEHLPAFTLVTQPSR